MGQRSAGGISQLLDGLADMFTYTEARKHGVSDRGLYRLRDEGVIETVGRGLYRRIGSGSDADVDLMEIAWRAPRATLCLTTALARHGLTDEIPASIDIALPRGQHRPVTTAPVTWHAFDSGTFDDGRSDLALDDQNSIGLYGPERSIIDAVRLRHHEGSELGYTALKRWLGRRGSSSASLLVMARRFPQVERALREALEIML